MKAELESSRGKITLHDNAAESLSLQPNARHDFIVRHDVKEIGQHTLTCSASYVLPDGERRVLPQSFKFTSSNPLSVRTKVAFATSCLYNTVRILVLTFLTPLKPTPTARPLHRPPNYALSVKQTYQMQPSLKTQSLSVILCPSE